VAEVLKMTAEHPENRGAVALVFRSVERASLVAAQLILTVLIGILIWTVFSRYALGDPIYWADDFCSVLLLWLAVLGAVYAARRNEHMRLTVLIDRLPERYRFAADVVAIVAFLVFAATLTYQGWVLTVEEFHNTMPALGVSVAWKSSAIIAGFGLVSIDCLARLRRLVGSNRAVAIVAALLALVYAGGLVLPAPALFAHINLPTVFFLFILVGVLVGVPIAAAFGLLTILYLVSMTETPLIIVANRVDEGMSNYLLLSVPLFIFLGLVIERCGLAKAMIDFIVSLLGNLRGGLHYALLVAMYLVSGISGSKAADMAAVAPAMFPEMKRRGADEGDLVALLGASAVMAETIPPSIILIVIGSVCGISIASLFASGYVPALIGMIALSAVVFFQHRRHEKSAGGSIDWRNVGRLLVVAVPGLTLPLLIRVAVGEGFATATEVATIGVVYSLAVGVVFYRFVKFRELAGLLSETISLTGAIFLIMGAATAMSWALTQSGFSQGLADVMRGVPGGSLGFLMISIMLFAVLGCLLEGLPAILIFGPLLFPIARSLGINDVHYAMVVIFAMGIGLFTPPIGIGFYAACGIAKVQPNKAIGKVWIPLGALVLATILIAVCPSLTAR
jgi:tripartite ATP-independent transporter DctM subunit